jgi:hypothetical protein
MFQIANFVIKVPKYGFLATHLKLDPEFFPSSSRVLPEFFPSSSRVLPEFFPSSSRVLPEFSG